MVGPAARTWRPWVAAVVVALATVSCSSIPGLSSGAQSGSPATSASPTSTAASDDDDGDGDESIEDLEAVWAGQRDRVVAALGAAEYGFDAEANVLSGPGRFQVDMDGCPDEWSDVAGTSPTSIDVAIVTAESGELASFADIARGMRAYFDYVNASGGVGGRSIALTIHDDAYDPALTTEVVDGLLAPADEGATSPFYVTTVGSPGSLAVYDDLNDACVPHPFVVSPHPAWGDPAGHPFTTGFQLSYTTEAIMWGRWIKDRLPDRVPVRVGALVMSNEFGQLYSDAFTAWAEANRDIVSEVMVVKHEPTAQNVSPEMDELSAFDPEVFLSMTAGQPCLSAIVEAARTGMTESAAALFTPSSCRQPDLYVAPAGLDGDGFWSVGGGVKSLNDPAFADDTFVAFARDTIAAAGLDPSNELIGVGFAQYGWAHVEMLRIADALPGGLSRTNLVLALRGSQLRHPILLDGVQFSAEGTRDGYFIEGGEYVRYDADAEAWFADGPAVDLNGSSPTCSFDDLACDG